MLIEKTVKIIKKVASDKNSQVDWNPELRKGVREEIKGMNDEIDLQEMQTRKHFQEVAKTVSAIPDTAKRQEFANHHARIFAKDNPRFDHKRFHQACGTLSEEMIDEIARMSTEVGARDENGRHIVPGGQGDDPRHSENPYHATIMKHGYDYSHSTPVNHYNGEVHIHHTYRKGDHLIGVGDGKWDTHMGGSGHHHGGSGNTELDKHLTNRTKRTKTLHEIGVFDENKIRYGVSRSLVEAAKGILETREK